MGKVLAVGMKIIHDHSPLTSPSITASCLERKREDYTMTGCGWMESLGREEPFIGSRLSVGKSHMKAVTPRPSIPNR